MRLPTTLCRSAAAALRTLAITAAMAGAAQAAPITIQLSSTDAVVNGTAGTDITIVLQADTTSFVTPNAFGGAGQYNGLTATVSSTDLGLAGVQATDSLSLFVGLDNFGVPAAVALLLGSEFAGVAGVTWDGVSNAAAGSLGGIATANGVTLNIGGNSYTITSFDTSNGVNDASFSATLQRANTVPEPAPLLLAGLALTGLAVQRRVRRSA